VHIALKAILLLRAGFIAALLLTACAPASAQTAYITQVNPRASGFTMSLTPQSIQLVPVAQTAPRETAFVPTPETSTSARNGNIAQITQIGNFNRVFLSQSGGNNLANVGVLGGNGNNVGVWQGGKDQSNLALINTQGLSIGVLQPPGAAPLNMLIARLPNGSLLIKR
jgi:hypothetical protein